MEPIYDGYSNSIENTGNYKKITGQWNRFMMDIVIPLKTLGIMENQRSEPKATLGLRISIVPRIHGSRHSLVKSRAILKRPKPGKKTHIGHATLYYNIMIYYVILGFDSVMCSLKVKTQRSNLL